MNISRVIHFIYDFVKISTINFFKIVFQNVRIDNVFFLFATTGDPQEECARCGKVYLSSSNQITHGFCTSCYATNQTLAPLINESSGKNLKRVHDSGSEEDSSNILSLHDDEDDVETNDEDDEELE